MKTEADGKLVTIYVTSRDRVDGHTMYSEIIKVCQDIGVAGVTVVRCQEGYGQQAGNDPQSNVHEGSPYSVVSAFLFAGGCVGLTSPTPQPAGMSGDAAISHLGALSRRAG